MRHRDGDDSDGDSRSTVRFTSTPQESSGLRERVLDTEDAARGPLSGIFRLTDSPRVMRKLQEYERAGKRKKEEPPPHPVQQPQPPKPQVNWTIRQFHPLRWSRTDDGWIFNEHFFFRWNIRYFLFRSFIRIQKKSIHETRIVPPCYIAREFNLKNASFYLLPKLLFHSLCFTVWTMTIHRFLE